MKRANVFLHNEFAGVLTEGEEGFTFRYDAAFLKKDHAAPVSLTLPLREQAYTSTSLFPFFDGLIPEGWLLDVVEKNWKLNPKDRMDILMHACRDCIGAVSIEPIADHA